MKLWRAEVGAGVAGQRLDDPHTWAKDELWAAAWFELEAITLREHGATDEAREEIHHARLRFCGTAVRDSAYRRAIYDRAVRTLGVETARMLSLRDRPRGKRAAR